MAANEFEAAAESYVDSIAPEIKLINEFDVPGFQESRTDSLKQSMFIANQTEPEEAYKYVELANKLDLPADFVGRNYEELSSKVPPVDYDSLIIKSPVTAEFLTDPENASVLRNQIPQLQKVEEATYDYNAIEGAFRNFTVGSSELFSGLAKGPAYLYEAANYTAQGRLVKYLTGAPDKAPDWLMNNPVSKLLDERSRDISPIENDQEIEEEFLAGNYMKAGRISFVKLARMVPNSTALLAGTVFGAVPLAVGASFLSGAGNALSETQNRDDLSQEQRVAQATLNPAIDAATEAFLGIPKVFKGIVAKVTSKYGKAQGIEFAKGLVYSMAHAFIQEGVIEEGTATTGQTLVDYLTDVNPNAFDNYGKNLRESIFLGGLAGSTMTAPAAVLEGRHRAEVTGEIVRFKDWYKAHGNTYEALEVREKLPQKAKEYIESVTQGTDVANVYISFETFQKYFADKNIDPLAEAEKLGISEQYNQAMEQGGDLKIPTANWSDYVGTEHWSGLENDVKTLNSKGEVGRSVNEWEQEKKDLEEQDRQAFQTASNEELESAQQVVQAQMQELKGSDVEQYSPEYSELAMGRAINRARRRGKGETPMQVWEETKAGFGGGDTLNQSNILDLTQRLEEKKLTDGLDNISKEEIDRTLSDSREHISQIKSEFNISDDVWSELPLEQKKDYQDKFNERYPDKKLVLYQDNGDSNLGTFDPITNSIKTLENANLSTYLHEMSHRWSFELIHDAFTEGTPQQLRDDLDALLAWLKLDVRSADGKAAVLSSLKTEHYEQIAEGTENYFVEGKAPSSALQRIFDDFAKWLLDVYKTFRKSDVKFSPEVIEVMNRILATDEAIEEAKKKLQPLFKDARAVGMSEEQALRYVELSEQAQSESKAILNKRLMAEITRKKEKEWLSTRKEIVEQVTKVADLLPVYAALDLMQKGTKDADGKTQRITLNRDLLVEEYGEEVYKRIQNIPGRKITILNGGVSAQIAAEMLGFESGDELLSVLATAPSKEEYIQRTADEQLLKLFPEILQGETLSDEALQAYHNENRSELLQMELDYLYENSRATAKSLTQSIARRPPTSKETKEFARNIVLGKSYAQQNPYKYYQAEKRYSRESGILLSKGDIKGAFEAKKKEQLNHELYRAATEIKQRLDSKINNINRLNNEDNRAKLGKAGYDYLEQADALLERFDFKKSVSLKEIEKRKSFKAWYDQQVEEGNEPVVPEYLLNESFTSSYKELTAQQILDIADTLANIHALAKLKNELLKNEEHRDFEEVKNLLIEDIKANATKTIKEDRESKHPQKSFGKSVSSFFASHRKIASFARQFSGWKDGGAWWNSFIRPLNNASNEETVMKQKAATELKELFDLYSKKEKVSLPGSDRLQFGLYKKVIVPGTNQSMSKMSQLMTVLYWGSEDGRQRILDSNEFTEQEVQAIINNLDERDVKFVKGVWKYLDSYWKDVNALNKRVTGLELEKAKSAPFLTKFGILDGGYLPLKYDSERDDKAYSHSVEEALKNAMKGASVRATTKHASRKARLENVERPLRYDFGVIFEHSAEVIHDVTHYETLLDLNKILRDSDIKKAIRTHYGNAVYAEFRDSLRDIAGGDTPSMTSLDTALNWLRSGISTAALGWNLMTAAKQPLGYAQSIHRIGPKAFARGMARFIGDASHMESSARWVYEKSSFMKTRGVTQSREISEIRNSIVAKGPLSFSDFGFFTLIQKMQAFVDLPTWIGAYDKALNEIEVTSDFTLEMREAKAVAMADQAVIDSQGSGETKDLASIQRGGPLKKIWTNFYSFFNTTLNANRESFGKVDFKSPASVAQLAADLLLINTMPVIGSMLLDAALRGSDDDDDEIIEKFLKEQAGYLMGQFVFLREFAGITQGMRGYEGPAGVRGIVEVGKLLNEVQQGELDEHFFKSLGSSAGILFHVPTIQIARTIDGLNRIANGETDRPVRSLLFGKQKGE